MSCVKAIATGRIPQLIAKYMYLDNIHYTSCMSVNFIFMYNMSVKTEEEDIEKCVID